MEVHSEPGIFQQFGEFPSQSDPEYPVAENARDFYKNGPSFLQRYLPFWVASYARRLLAILVTVLAIAVPVFSFAPKAYLWFLRRRIIKLYRDLRLLDQGLGRDMTAAELNSATANWIASSGPPASCRCGIPICSSSSKARLRSLRPTSPPVPPSLTAQWLRYLRLFAAFGTQQFAPISVDHDGLSRTMTSRRRVANRAYHNGLYPLQ